MVSEKQKTFFENLKKLYGKAPLPSFEKIAKDFGFKHKNSVWQYFNKLREEDLILENCGRFFINPSAFGAVLFTSAVRAGFASAGEDSIERRISLDETFDLDNPSTFLFTVSGDSMVNAGIFDGDKVIIKKAPEARNGDIVLAHIDGGFTLKRLCKKDGKVWLHPENPAYPDIIPEQSLTIFGTASGIVRKL